MYIILALQSYNDDKKEAIMSRPDFPHDGRARTPMINNARERVYVAQGNTRELKEMRMRENKRTRDIFQGAARESHTRGAFVMNSRAASLAFEASRA